MRHVVAYLLVVGGPLLGLLGVLRIGQHLPAPMAVHGAYTFGIRDSSAAGSQPCLLYLLSGSDSTLHITQSGAQLAATLGPEGNVGLRGALAGDRVMLTGTIDAAMTPDSVPCAPGDSVRLAGVVSSDPSLKRLHGTVSAGTCASCGGIEVSARRPRG